MRIFKQCFLIAVSLFSLLGAEAVLADETPNPCVKVVTVTPPTGQWYWSVDLVIKNNCTTGVNLKGAYLNIQTPFSPAEYRASFDKSDVSWAPIKLEKSVKGAAVPNYPELFFHDSVFSFTFPEGNWVKTILKPGNSINLTLSTSLSTGRTFTDALKNLIQASFALITTDTPPVNQTGQLVLSLDNAPVTDTAFPKSSSFTISGPNNYIKTVALNWGEQTTISNLVLGTYNVTATTITYNNVNYQPKLPASVELSTANPSSTVLATYIRVEPLTGTINLTLDTAPTPGLADPVIDVYDVSNNVKQTVTLNWGTIKQLTQMPANHVYQITASPIPEHVRAVTPSNFTLAANTNVNAVIKYEKEAPPPAIGQVSLTVNGLPSGVNASLTFSSNINAEVKTFTYSNGTYSLSLAAATYNVSANTMDGYRVVIASNPFVVSSSSTVPTPLAITYEKVTPTPNQANRVVAYFTAWGIYARNYQVTDIPALKVTDINYAFLNIQNGRCVLGDPWAETDKRYPAVTTSLGTFIEDSWNGPQLPYYGNLNRLNQLRDLALKKGHKVNLIFSIGGWTWSKYFSDVALTDASREIFVQSCVELMHKYKFDGLDLDWEYPVGGGLSDNIYRQQDKQNYTLLLKRFREVMGPDYKLTIAAPAGPTNIVNLEWEKISKYIDWMNLMTYDFHGSWENKTGHNAPLYHNPADPSTDLNASKLNVSSAVSEIVKQGMPSRQVVLGLGFYGRGWQNVPEKNNGLFQSGTLAQVGTWENGVFDYWDLLNKYKNQGYTEYYDFASQVPYLYNPTTKIFITYDNVESIKAKVDYIKTNNLGGAMFWELSGDLRDSNSPYSLLGLLARELLTP
jgi:chitinase